MDHLRILVYKCPEGYIGQCLEHDICVQCTELDDIRRRVANQISFFESGLAGGLSDVPPAPDEFFEAWDSTNGDPMPITLGTVSKGDMRAEVKVKELIAA